MRNKHRDLHCRSWQDHHAGPAGWWWPGCRHWSADHTETPAQTTSARSIHSATQRKLEGWVVAASKNCLQAAALACLFPMTWWLAVQCQNNECAHKIQGYCRLHRTASSYFCSHPALCSVSPLSSICSPQVFWLMRLLLSMLFLILEQSTLLFPTLLPKYHLTLPSKPIFSPLRLWKPCLCACVLAIGFMCVLAGCDERDVEERDVELSVVVCLPS